MKRLAILLLLIAGCGSGVGEPMPGRTGSDTVDAVDALYAAADRKCHEWGMDDDQIDMMFIVGRADRAAGTSMQDALYGLFIGCLTMPCLECGTAVIDAVYTD